MISSGDPAVLYVGDDRFLPRLQSYLELAAALRERVPEIDYVDLRFDDRIYVRPARTRRGDRRSVRQAGEASRGQTAERRDGQRDVQRRQTWRAKSGIWSGSTSAPRR